MFQRHGSRNLSIGMFDSGVGGLTVMQQTMRLLPSESIIYFGDTARVPYGGKSRETIIRYSIENAIFLMEQDVKVIVIACSTAASVAKEKLRQIFNIPIIDVIEPGAERAAQLTKNGHIAVIGTRGTIQSGVYQQQILKHLPTAQVTSIACPLFVPIVEEGFASHASTKLIVQEYLSPLRKQKVDTLVLGCTHYPLLRKEIEKEIDPAITIVDTAVTCAAKTALLLKEQELETKSVEQNYSYYVSDDPEKFRMLGRDFLGMAIENVLLKDEVASVV